MPSSPITWILVADRGRARIVQTGEYGTLTEVACFVNPDGRAAAHEVETHALPTVNESAGPARHSIEPHTTFREKSATRFARMLRDALALGHNQHRYERLVLVAPPRFLGALHGNLETSMRNRVIAEVRHDLTALPIRELREHLPQHLFT